MKEAVMCTSSHRFLTIIESLSIIALLAAFIFPSSRVDRRLKALRDQYGLLYPAQTTAVATIRHTGVRTKASFRYVKGPHVSTSE